MFGLGNSSYICHLDRSVSWGRRPPKRMRIGLRKVWSAITPNFVISTGAKRSGEICGFPHLAQRARQIWGTLDWWRFWIHTSSGFRVPHPCVARMGNHNRWQSTPPRMIFERAKPGSPAKRNREICGYDSLDPRSQNRDLGHPAPRGGFGNPYFTPVLPGGGHPRRRT